jgi:hypothetical protein
MFKLETPELAGLKRVGILKHPLMAEVYVNGK